MDSNVISKPHLLIKIPTRSRPAQFFKMLDVYYKKLSKKIDYTFLITCDTDDASMNNDVVKSRLKKYRNLVVHFDNNTTKVEAYNNGLAQVPAWDIVVVTSDDMLPIARGYDKTIVDNMLHYFPEFDGVLNFFDGYASNFLNTMPIIGKKFYQRFGYIYNPIYKSLYCDQELTLVSRMLKKEVIFNITIIEHQHPHHGTVSWDDLYKKNESYDSVDKAIFEQRQASKFDL